MSARLIPPTSDLTAPYWEAARRKELVIQCCDECNRWLFPPRAHCPQCGSDQLLWRPVSGKGVVYTFTIAYRPPHPVFSAQCPFTIAIVELAEGPRMMTNVIGCEPARVRVGMAVTVAFETIDDSDLLLPVFTPG